MAVAKLNLRLCHAKIGKRKYDEFYVLDSKLKEFHGGGLSHINDKVESLNTQLPNKQRAMFFVSNSRNLEYLNSVKNDFK